MVELIPNPEFERVALPALASYRDAVPGAFVPPPLAEVRTRARRRVVVRNWGLAAATAGMVAAVTVGVALFPARHQGTPPPGGRPDSTPTAIPSTTASPPATSPTASPPAASPTASPTRSAAVTEPMPTSWAGRTVVLPAPSGYQWCPQGPVTIANGKETVVGNAVVGVSETRATGDLTGDGQPEAVVYVYCRQNSDFATGDGTGHLLVITRGSAGRFVGLAHVGPDGEEYPTVRVRDGVLAATIQRRYDPQIVQDRIYRWDGTGFEQVGGPTAWPSN